MRSFAIILASLAVASCGVVPLAPGLLRAPAHDSAIIRSDRLGGNFAYSIQEGHAYQAIAPVVQHLRTPVAVSYQAPVVAHAPIAPFVAVEQPKVEIKEAELKFVAPAPAPIVYQAPTVQIENVKPVELKYVAPVVVHDEPKVEVKEEKVELKYVAPAPFHHVVPAVHQVVYDAPKIEVKQVEPFQLKYTPYVQEAPKVEIKEVEPVKVEYKVPEVQYKAVAYPFAHHLPYAYHVVTEEKKTEAAEEAKPAEESN